MSDTEIKYMNEWVVEDYIAILEARNAKLVAAIRRIDAINDNPAIFNKDIDDVCAAALQRSTNKNEQ